jgi:predicted secreted protein
MPDRRSPEREQDVKRIASLKGATFVVNLWEDRTRGELWVPMFDRSALALFSDEFLRIASNNAVDAGRRSFEFQAVAPGVHRIVFEKRMGWKFTAEDRRVFHVTVSDRAGAPLDQNA